MNVSAWPSTPCYLYGNMQIFEKSKGLICVKDLEHGDAIPAKNGKFVRVLHNIKFLLSVHSFVLIKKDSISKHVPCSDFLITEDTPILINNKIIKPIDIPGRAIVPKKTCVYSICTENEEWISIENIFVKTFSKEEWENELEKRIFLN